MPKIWLCLLLQEKLPDKASTLIKLKYEYTVDDVYDLIEFYDIQNKITEIQNRNNSEENRNANR